MRLSIIERKVLVTLVNVAGDLGCYSFAGIMRRTKLTRREVRLACRSLTRKGLAEFHKGLWSEDGEPAGSGYCASCAGIEMLKDGDQAKAA